MSNNGIRLLQSQISQFQDGIDQLISKYIGLSAGISNKPSLTEKDQGMVIALNEIIDDLMAIKARDLGVDV